VDHRASLDGCGKSPEIRSRTVQPVTSRYTDYAIPALECLLLALGIQHAQRLRHIIYGLSNSTIFLHTVS